MTFTSHTRNYASPFLFALSSLLTNAAFGWSDDPDPTTPSPQIAERLALDEVDPKLQPTYDVGSQDLRLHHLRLTAIVLRDSDNGTALVSPGDSEVYVVSLRRKNLHSTANRLNIGGIHLAVEDFSESSVILRSLDTNQQFIIN